MNRKVGGHADGKRRHFERLFGRAHLGEAAEVLADLHRRLERRVDHAANFESTGLGERVVHFALGGEFVFVGRSSRHVRELLRDLIY